MSHAATLSAGKLIDSEDKIKVTPGTAKAYVLKQLDKGDISSWAIVWFLIRRHKFGLSMTLNAVLIATIVRMFIENGVR